MTTQIERPDLFRRDQGAPFDELSREEFAKARAKGLSIKASSTAAGINPVTGAKFAGNEAIKERIRELRKGAETYIAVSKAWIIAELMKNVGMARDAEHYKSSNEALALLYKIVSEDREVGANLPRELPIHVSPRELQQRLQQSFAEPRLPPRASSPAVDTEAEDA